MRTWLPALLLALLLAAAAPADEAGLFSGLGDHRHPIETDHPLAQRFFDQGLVLAFAFNQSEAAESFRQVQRLDPDCAMGWWGEAWTLGPGINCCTTEQDSARAATALARARTGRADARHREYIQALAARQEHGQRAYAVAMTEVAGRHATDDDAQVLAAQAWMETAPWDYWTPAGEPKPAARQARDLLERVLARSPQHPMANHLQIHLHESAHPDRALASAQRLETLVPGAPHLLHMPAHVYLRLGRYHDANEANLRALAADEEYLRQRKAFGMPPRGLDAHNLRFLWFGQAMAGQSAASRETAQRLRDLPSRLQGDSVAPLWTMVRFGLWDQALAEAEPPGGLPYPTGVWRFARGMALARRGGDAHAELAALQAALERAAPEDRALLAVAERMLAAAIAEGRGDLATAAQRFREAVAREDRLPYAEPAAWPLPVRQYLGAVLQGAEAERVYREDLARWPGNGWSLKGLGDPGFAAAWSRADIALDRSCR